MLSPVRWWEQFRYIPWPDKLAMNLLTFLPGDGERRRVRRLVVRLAHLSSVLALREIEPGSALIGRFWMVSTNESKAWVYLVSG